MCVVIFCYEVLQLFCKVDQFSRFIFTRQTTNKLQNPQFGTDLFVFQPLMVQRWPLKSCEVASESSPYTAQAHQCC